MEFVGQYRRLPTPATITIRLPHYIWLIFYLLTGITISVTGVSMAAYREVSNPFAAFNDLFGDNARQAALARGFTCRDTRSGGLARTMSDYCAQRDIDEMFSGISMRMSGESAVEISFSLRENTLSLGDLVLLWGEPEIRQSCTVVAITWPAHRIHGFAAPPSNGQISYFLPIQSVSFTRSGSPQWGQFLMADAQYYCG
jgi:hypothetical protein